MTAGGTALAMRIVVGTAEMMGASRLIDVDSAHVDGCLYHGRAGLDFAERLVAGRGRVSVPTTLNVGALDLLILVSQWGPCPGCSGGKAAPVESGDPAEVRPPVDGAATNAVPGAMPVGMSGQRVYIDPASVVLGDVVLGDDCSVWPMAVIRGDMHRIRIGARTSVQDGSVLHITHASDFNPDGFPLTIGEEVTIGHKAILHGCTLGNRILVGMGAIVMDGAVVEGEVIIAAGAVVTPGKRLEGGHVYAGNPAKALRPLKEKERAFFPYTAGNYVKLKDEYLRQGASTS